MRVALGLKHHTQNKRWSLNKHRVEEGGVACVHVHVHVSIIEPIIIYGHGIWGGLVSL